VVAEGTFLVSSSITVNSHSKLTFLGGVGNTTSSYPSSYIIKKSTMSSPAIIISTTGTVVGGGVICQAGNTGDGILLDGNSAKLYRHFVSGAGNDGIRVGSDSTSGGNWNSCVIEHCTAQYNGRYGLNIHDGVSTSAANANAITVTQLFSRGNGSHGIYIGHAYWITLINCLTDINGGYGLYLSGENYNSYPACRYATVVGGDYNEGNTLGTIYDSSYYSTILNPDVNTIPTNVPVYLQGAGSGLYLSPRSNYMTGGVFDTKSGTYPVIFSPQRDSTIAVGGVSYPIIVKSRTSTTPGNGNGLKFQIQGSSDSTYNYVDSSIIKSVIASSGNKYTLKFGVYDGTALSDKVELHGGVNSWLPTTDNATALGWSSNRWSVVYAGTGTINTSDEREKTFYDIEDAEIQCAKECKTLIKKYKFNSSITEKGEDNARFHFGSGAQTIQQCFIKYGLNPENYGIFCYDKWDEVPEEKDEDGNITKEYIPAGDRYGLRYDELAMFILGAI
jgi:hypothetical protein